MLQKQDCRFVSMKCSACGETFPVIYWFNPKNTAPFGKGCIHVHDPNVSFDVLPGYPTFNEWYAEQMSIREELNDEHLEKH